MSIISKPSVRQRITSQKNTYETAAGWLLSSLILIGVILFCLFVIWLTNQTQSIAASRAIMPPGGEPAGSDDQGLDLDMPLADQVGQETDVDMDQNLEAFTMLENVLGTHAHQLDRLPTSEEPPGARVGGSTGIGDAAAPGDGPGPGGVIAREDRWVVLYDQTSLDQYARQLDHFRIELGVLGKGQLLFISDLAKSQSAVRHHSEDVAENRLHFNWAAGSLRKFDQELCRKAGISPEGRIIVHLYSAELEQTLADLERGFRGQEAEDIRRTRFAVRAQAAGGFEYYVVDQELR